MNIEYLTKYLKNNPKDIKKILEFVGFTHISFFEFKNEIRCAWEDGSNPTAVCINVSNLLAISYSHNIGGTLFTLIMKKNNWNLNKTCNIIAQLLNIENNNNNINSFIFGGFYKKNYFYENNKELQTYSENLLNDYTKIPNIRFLKDNISIETQFKFNIMYDNLINRIIVPWYDQNGNLKGVTGRYNFDELGENPKWKSVINFPKGKMLYGLYQNLPYIKKENSLIIGESEKFVMQLDTYGYHNAVALGGCNISNIQARIIKSLPISKVIIALDEGLDIEHILAQAQKLKNGIFNNIKEVYVLYNNDNKILPKGSKMSPTDLGKENFEKLLEKYCFKKE